MTKDDLHHDSVASPERSPRGLRVMSHEDETIQPPGAPDRGRQRSSPPSEPRVAREIDDCLRELVRTRAIDVAALAEGARQEQRAENRRRRIKRVAAFSAMVSALALGGAIFQELATTHVTGDAPRLIALEDGSQVELNANSAMQVNFSADTREVTLTRGEGMFKVRADSKRPFRVQAGKAIVEAVGTQFDVRLTNQLTAIAVVEGAVQVKPVSSPSSEAGAGAAQLPPITAGLSITVDREGRADAPKVVDVIAITAWRRSLGLVFTDAPLAEIAAEINHRNMKPKLIIEGDALRARRFALSLDAANSEALVNYLKEEEGLLFIITSDQVIVRERNP